MRSVIKVGFGAPMQVKLIAFSPKGIAEYMGMSDTPQPYTPLFNPNDFRSEKFDHGLIAIVHYDDDGGRTIFIGQTSEFEEDKRK